MRILASLAALVLATPAFAIDVVAEMPVKTPGDTCQLFMNGMAASTPKPCGSAQSFPDLIPGDGLYAFTYRTVNNVGLSRNLSPERTVAIGTLPEDPTERPDITIACNPAPCPASIVITITP